MNFKKDIEKVLDSLKESGYDRRRIERELNYSENYIDQTLSRGGNRKILRMLQSLQEAILQKDQEPASTSLAIRTPKVVDDPRRDGVLFVPIAAQAGYTQHFHDPLYLSQLERIYIPGFPYRGDNYRIFEVAGDSMEPTLKEGYYIVGEKVEPEHWHTIADYYIFAIITEDRCMVKRLVKREGDFVAISDNDFHPQFVLSRQEVKEIWYIKRKIDWEMPPPKRIELTV